MITLIGISGAVVVLVFLLGLMDNLKTALWLTAWAVLAIAEVWFLGGLVWILVANAF